MSATVARQGGREQPEQSDMRLALNMAKMAKGGFSCATIEETQCIIKKPAAEVQEEKMRGVEFRGNNNVKSAMERHPAMLRENQTDGCLPCQKLHRTESPDTLETQKHGCTSTRLTQAADTRINAISTRNATCSTQ